MKTRIFMLWAPLFSLVIALTTVTASAQGGSTFTFQGTLSSNNSAVNGSCDFKFRLFDTMNSANQVGGLNDKTGVTVSNGLFTVALDFGNVFTGDVRWLETQVRCPSGNGGYATLTPRQPVMPHPYALYAANAQNASGAAGDFVAQGELRSSRNPVDGAAGGLTLENPLTHNAWGTVIRAGDLDKLSFDYWDATRKLWRFGARLDADSNLQIQGGFDAGSITANYIYSHGYLESNRIPGGTYPANGGTLVLANGTTGNKWELPIRADNYDSLDFYAWNAGLASWHRAATLSKDGNLIIAQRTNDNATLLTLDHPKTKWLFHVNSNGHPELGVFDQASQTTQWNVLEINPTTGNLGIGMAASPVFRLLVYQTLAVSTGDSNSSTLLQLHHPKAQLHFNFDGNGHPEIQVKNPATDQFALNVLDIDQTNGHVGIGEDATANDRLRVNGNFTATGTKAATVDTTSYGKRKLYAVEAADVRFSDEGLAHLVDGQARIELDPVFLETIKPPFIITVTPYGDASLYVAEIGADFFVIKAHAGDPQVAFAWRLSAPRKGYENVRLEQADQP
ncbi:MAG: hypothetical protein U0350_00325 [Caldilineaceae bacterium]